VAYFLGYPVYSEHQDISHILCLC